MESNSKGIIQERIHSIDIMKFLAVLLITNSHMASLYPPTFRALATGGAIGDSIFFFCSGFLLAKSRGGDFFNWYKRRINRIFPTIFAIAIFGIVFFGTDPSLKKVILSAGGWFVQCIFVFYAVFWFVKKFLSQKIWIAIVLDFIIILVWYIFFWDKEVFIIADATYLRWPIFFLSMLVGAVTTNIQVPQLSNKSLLYYIVSLIALLVFYYGFQIFESKIPGLYLYQIFLAFVLLAITFVVYRICSHPNVVKVYTNRYLYHPIYWMSALCLETYLCQTWVFPVGEKMISLFPMNIIITFVFVFSLAYCVKVFSNFLSQTFKSEDYNWRKMITL